MQRLSNFFHLCTLGLVVQFFAGETATLKAETWTDLRGTSTVEAEMVGRWDDQVILRLENGKRITVQLRELRAESRILAQRLATEMDATRAERINEFKLQREAAAAPAPDVIPQPPAASEYRPPGKAENPASYFQSIDLQIRQGHVLALFDALPASFRKDLESLAKLAATKVDGKALQSVTDELHQLGNVVVSHQNWFLSHPSVQADAKTDTEYDSEADGQFNDSLLLIAGFLRASFDPDKLDVAKLKDQPLRDWLAERDAAIAPYLAELFEKSNSNRIHFSNEEKNGKVAGVRITADKGDVAVPTKRIEGVWLPSSVADQWESRIAAIRNQLKDAEDQSLFADAVPIVASTTLNTLTYRIANADNENDFHREMRPLLLFLESALAAIQTFTGIDVGLVVDD